MIDSLSHDRSPSLMVFSGTSPTDCTGGPTSTYPASSMACTYFPDSVSLTDSSQSYFKIDCGGSPQVQFYSDSSCTTMGSSTIPQGTCSTSLSTSNVYSFSCPGSASGSLPSPPPPTGS